MSVSGHPRTADGLGALVVSYRSAAVLAPCLECLRIAAPRRGVDVRVVDNASDDGSADLAARLLGEAAIVRLPVNGGFAAGVNAGLEALGAFGSGDVPVAIAVINPDVRLEPGSLDRLWEELERHPRAALIGPRVIGDDGRPERTVGRFPSLAREAHHALMLDRWFGLEGRTVRFPARVTSVDWVSGCAWLLRTSAAREVGPLDEGYFMYVEDVDYARRLHDSGWDVLATPGVTAVHGLGRGSAGTAAIAADGGAALLRYFEKFHPADAPAARRLMVRGWRARLVYRSARAALGDARSASLARRYRLALDAVAAL